MKHFFVIISLLILSACSGGGAVVFAPTALPPEVAPNEYSHPSGAFSLLLPRTWTLYEQTSSLFASATFAPPNSDTPLVQIATINLGRDVLGDELGDIMNQYQSQVRPDLTRYTEEGRQAMGDGSWRMTGLRQNSGGETQQVNTFIQANGNLLLILEVVVPLDASLQSQTQTIINTLSLATSADLPVSDLSVLANVAQAEIQIVNLSTWTSSNGVFYVTGEVSNSSERTIAELPVRAQLQTQGGEVLADGTDIVMGYAIESGGFAPFSIRFGQGQPANTTRYTVSLGSEDYIEQTAVIIGFPTLQWVDETQTTQDGVIFITGTITNTGEEGVLSPRAIVTLFDEGGRMIGTAFADADRTSLPAEETANFNVSLSEIGGIPSNYVVNVQALPCDASCE
ncbi:MAG: hypothetical protein Phog2KO_15810 [Phototrophicaceae bacterium]